MPGIEDTPEWKQSQNMRNACNRVYREVFDIDDDGIIRFTAEDGPHILDVEFAIDLKILLPSGSQLSGQEKALSNQFYKYRTFTMEYYQNRFTQEPGEWFKIASQFYLSGYSDESGIEFIEWHIIKMFALMLWLKGFEPEKLSKKCRPSGGSRASFLPIPYDKIPEYCIYASGKGEGNTKIFDSVEFFLNGNS